MGLYNVVQPCIVGGKHYTRPKSGVEVDDAEAGPLVESGELTVHESAPEPADGPTLTELVGDDEPEADEATDEQAPPRRGGRAR